MISKNTIIDVFKKHGFENTIDLDKYLIRQPNEVNNINAEQLNTLKPTTIQKLLTDNSSAPRFIFNNWKGERNAYFYYNLVKEEYSFTRDHIQEILEDILSKPNAKEILIDLIYIFAHVKNETLKYNLFTNSNKDINLIYQLFDKEVLDAIIETNHQFDMLYYMPSDLNDNITNIIFENLDRVITDESFYFHDRIMQKFDVSTINKYERKSEIIKAILHSLESANSYEKLKELEKYVPDLLKYCERISYKVGEYYIEKTYGITKDNLNYEMMVDLDDDIIGNILDSNLRDKAKSIIMTKEFIDKCKFDKKYILTMIDYSNIEGIELVEYLFTKLGDDLPKYENIMSLLNRIDRYPRLEKFIKVYSDELLIETINDSYFRTKNHFIAYLIDEVLTRNKDYADELTIKKKVCV